MAVRLATEAILKELVKRVAKGDLKQSQLNAFKNNMENMTPESLISAGYLNPKLEPSPTNIKRAINTILKEAEKTPAAYRREQVRSHDNMTIFDEAGLPPKKIITPEQLADEKKVLVPNISDQSATDRTVNRVGGFDLAEPVTTYGGMDFSRKVSDQGIIDSLGGNQLAWGSNKGAMQTQSNQNNEIAGLLADQGYTPVAVNTVLSPEATSFAHPFADSLVQIMQQHVKLPKKVAQQFDKEVREGKQKFYKGKPVFKDDGSPEWARKPFADWKGINNPESLKQVRETDGGKRQAMLDVAFTQKYQQQGFPKVQSFNDAFNLPEMPRGSGGYSFYEPEIGKDIVELPDSIHPDYSHANLGAYKGGFEAPTSARTMMPDVVKSYEDRGLRESDAIGAFMMNPNLFQLPTSDWVKGNTKAIEKNAELIKRYGSLGAAVMAGHAVADPVSDLRASERQFGMTDQDRAIDDLRASEAANMMTNDQSQYYDDASGFMGNVGQSLKGAGLPSGLIDLMTPDYDASARQAMGDDSFSNGLFAMLEKLDPTALAGLIGSGLTRKRR